MHEVTRILEAIGDGNSQAADQLLPLVYDELRKLAAHKLAHEKPGQTLQATALVHEAYLRLVDVDKAQHWDSRGHFFAAAAEAMRRILVDQARQKRTLRRGRSAKRLALDQIQPAVVSRDEDLLALDEALHRLEHIDKTKAALVKLRYFAGLSIPQAAKALRISVTTANRYWAYARAWLHEELRSDRDAADH
ncbi:MAG: sigma-70 family RNA polymerase sigma factor [Pirellulales bacterium]